MPLDIVFVLSLLLYILSNFCISLSFITDADSPVMPAPSQASAVDNVPTFVVLSTAISIPGPIPMAFFARMDLQYRPTVYAQNLLPLFNLLPCWTTIVIPPMRRPAETCASMLAHQRAPQRNASTTAVTPAVMKKTLERAILGRRASYAPMDLPLNAIWCLATCDVPRAVSLEGRTNRQLNSSSIHQYRRKSPRPFPLDPIPRHRAVVRRQGQPLNLLWFFKMHAM